MSAPAIIRDPGRWPTTGEPCQACCGTGKEPDQKQLAEDLLRYREWHEARASDVAREMGVSRSYVCDLEHGTRAWRKDLIDAYRAAVMKVAQA